MINEHCSSLIVIYLTSFSAGYIIQTYSFTFLFTSCIVNMFENKSKSVNILILVFYICPLEGHRVTPIPSSLHIFHEHRIQVFIVYIVFFFYILHRLLIHTSNPPS